MKFKPAMRLQGIEKSMIRQISDLADGTCINLGLGEPEFDTPPSLVHFARETLLNQRLGYTSNAGLPELRKLLAERSGLGIDAESVCVTVGAQGAMYLAIMSVVNPGDEVLITNPGFPAFTTIARIAGGVPVYVDLDRADGFAVTADAIARRMSDRTKLIILNSPANPTGTVISAAELEKLAHLIDARECYVLSDETYNGLYYEQRPESIARYSDKAIVIASLSKSYSMTGWRLGWVIARPEIIRPVTVLNQYTASNAPTLSQRAAIQALKSAEVDRERLDLLGRFTRRRNLMLSLIQNVLQVPYINPLGAFYVFADFSRWGPSLELAKRLLAATKVVTIPGIAFGSRGEGFLRLSFAASEENIEQGIKRIGEYLRGL
jgi:aspartate/methionine/tyrosine aminotransferase